MQNVIQTAFRNIDAAPQLGRYSALDAGVWLAELTQTDTMPEQHARHDGAPAKSAAAATTRNNGSHVLLTEKK